MQKNKMFQNILKIYESEVSKNTKNKRKGRWED